MAATRKLTDDERSFLRHLARFDRPVSRNEMNSSASREEDRVRQTCRREGWAEFKGGFLDGKWRRMGWMITTSGRAALSEDSNA